MSVASVDQLLPAFASDERAATITSAVATLVSTIVGGGSLSLPFAFARIGLPSAVALLVLIAGASDAGAGFLVEAARRSGGASYEDVAYKAYGKGASIGCTLLLVSLTFMCCIAYLILIGDFVVPLADDFLFPSHSPLGSTGRAIAISACALLVSPLCFMTKLAALRFTSGLSFTSMVFLTGVIVTRAVQHVKEVGWSDAMAPVQNYTGVEDTLYGFPLIAVSFLCHFNILPVHTELTRPTRSRIKRVIHITMCIVGTLYIVIGSTGLVTFAGRAKIDGDVLKNYPRDDGLVQAGRGALLLTLLCNFPLLCVPCRVSLDKLVLVVRDSCCLGEDSVEPDALTAPLLGGEFRAVNTEAVRLAASPKTKTWDDPVGPADAMIDRLRELARVSADRWARVRNGVETVVILGSSLAIAIAVPNVVVVWSFMGSTVSMLIAMIIPAVLFLKIRTKASTVSRSKAWILLVFGCVMGVACTYQSVVEVL